MPRHDQQATESDSDSESFQMPACTRCTSVLTEDELVLFKQNRGRCSLCQELWVEKAICPVCEVQWDDEDLDMVGCDSCDFWVHQKCDRLAALAAETEEEYQCPVCRERQARREKRAAAGLMGAASLLSSSPSIPQKRPVGRPPKMPGGPGRPQGLGRALGRPPLHRRPPGRPPKDPLAEGPEARGAIAGYTGPDSEPSQRPLKRELGRLPDQDDFMAERPFKRGPGTLHAEPQAAYDDSDMAERPVKRGRGRPPKNRSLEPGGRLAGGRGRDDILSAGVRVVAPKRPKTPFQMFCSELKRQLRQDGLTMRPDELLRHAKDLYSILPDHEHQIYEKRAIQHRERQAALQATAPMPSPMRSSQPSVMLSSGSAKHGMRSMGMLQLHAPSQGGLKTASQPAVGNTSRGEGSNDLLTEPNQRNALQLGETILEKASPSGQTKEDNDGLPETVDVICNGVTGTFSFQTMQVTCTSACCRGADSPTIFTPTHFEAHAGAGAAKKWKASLRIAPGGAPDVPRHAPPLMIGKWLDMHNVDTKTTGRGPKPGPGQPPPPMAERKQKPEATPGPPPVLWEPWNDVKNGNYIPIRATWAGDRCGVCSSDIDSEADQLVSCDMCGTTVHQSCYGIRELPAVDDIWLCRACEMREMDSKQPQCIVCPIEGGPLKPTTIPGAWCHVSCMWWISMLRAGDEVTMEPVEGVMEIEKARWELKCTICKQTMGAKIQCRHPKCYAAFHPTCGQMAGTHMEMVEAGGAIEHITFCPKHCTPHPQMACVQPLAEALGPGRHLRDYQEGVPGAALSAAVTGPKVQTWNAQPYQQPPGLPVPECSAGCSRAQALADDWQRQNHGTGAGYTSLKGFWMPEITAAMLQSDGPALSLGKRGRTPFGGGGGSADPDAPFQPPEETPLMDLPSGIPETIPIVCNGRKAFFTVRTQYVEYQGDTMTASKFEQFCGKGDAKKWKSSLLAADESGEAICTMQDWLGDHSLDRKVLQALQQNALAHDAWKNYMAGRAEERQGADTDDLKADQDDEADVPAPDAGASEGERVKDHSDEAANGMGASASPTNRGDAEDHIDGTPSSATKQIPSGDDFQRPRVEAEEQEEAEEAAAARKIKVEKEGGTGVKQEHTDMDNEAKAPDEDMHVGAAEKDLNHEQELDEESSEGEEGQADDPDEGANDIPVQLREQAAEHGSESEVHSPPDIEAFPASALGCFLRLYWPDDDEWYEAKVCGYDPETSCHAVFYPMDGDTEWINLVNEQLGSRIQWLPGSDRTQWPPAQPPPPGQCRYFPEADGAAASSVDGAQDRSEAGHAEGSGRTSSQTGERENEEGGEQPGNSQALTEAEEDGGSEAQGMAPPPFEEDSASAVGWRVGVWWPDDACFYYGVVERYDQGKAKYLVHYDDNEIEWLALTSDIIKWVSRNGESKSQATRETQRRAAADVGAAPKYQAPETVNVICNGMTAVFNVKSSMVMMEGGSTVTPTEFERLAGKSASKKWKASIRIDRGCGMLGQTIGDWLAGQGVPGAKPASRATGGGPGPNSILRLAALRARQLQMSNRSLVGGGSGHGNHRSGCMCSPCKQARAKTGQQGGGAASSGGGRGRQRYRTGKAAYLRAVPMLVSAGPVTHQLWQVPHSQSWSPVDWAEERAPGEGPAAGMSDSDEEDEDGPREKIPDAMNVVEFPANNSEDFKVEDAEVKTEVKEEGSVGEGDVPGALVPHSRSSGALRGGMSQVERLRQCVATERARLTFGKSGIHGWGLFAKKDMKAGSMVIEYRGETMRPSIAERREADYHKEGKDCYLFTVNENHVIDSTMRGTIGRFTNHSCQPSMYTRTIDIDNEPHLIFYTRTEVAAGQELTYDYRFKEESGDNKMSCGCGAPNCRGTMN